MTDSGGPEAEGRGLDRRRFLTLTGGALAASSSAILGKPSAAATAEAPASEPFWGAHQGGILTTPQRHTFFAAFDLVAEKRDEVAAMLREWTAASARLATGQTAQALGADLTAPGADGGASMGLHPERLTLTFGFGPGLFERDGHDRYGLKQHRPEALVDLPSFHGDQLLDTRTGGDISVQACSDDPQVAFHAVRELARLGYGVVEMRWAQTGFTPNYSASETPRNLMGFKDGTSNPAPGNPHQMNQFVWVGSEGPAWMHNGSYVVVRRIRMALEHWDRMPVGFQEQAIGRHKYTGAPIGGKHERDPVNLAANDHDGNPIVPENAHVRLAMAASNDGAQILRRGYSYNDGVSFTAERWPPWRQGMEYDAGLFFVAYQRDPRTGFIKIFEKMSQMDMLNQFVTHTGGGIFACPGGAAPGEYIGQRLFATG